jgi:ATP-dependent Clp protease protease subunit
MNRPDAKHPNQGWLSWPRQPSGDEPPPGSGTEARDAWLQEQLFSRRILLLNGYVDMAAANRAAAQLMLLDGISDAPIQLHLSSPDADLAAALALVDTLELVTAPVHAVVIGQVGGAALGILSVADDRRAQVHATFRLVEPRTDLQGGNADEVADQVAQHNRLLLDLQDRLAAATGRQIIDVAADMQRGKFMTAAEALEYGLLDRLSQPGSRSG